MHAWKPKQCIEPCHTLDEPCQWCALWCDIRTPPNANPAHPLATHSLYIACARSFSFVIYVQQPHIYIYSCIVECTPSSPPHGQARLNLIGLTCLIGGANSGRNGRILIWAHICTYMSVKYNVIGNDYLRSVCYMDTHFVESHV